MVRSPDPNPRSDGDLLEAYRRGELRAFEELFDRHATSVFTFAYRFCGDHDLAEDVVQDCFRDLVDRIDSFQLTGSLSSWFYVVAKRRALRLKERTKRESIELDESTLASLQAKPSSQEDATGDLRRVVAQLPPSQQEALVLRYLDGFSLEEIAEILEIPLGTVKSRIHNGLRTLKLNPACRRYFER
jgi:RNA polymerase sigma-70 factor, ECF subfamily